ncbi:uncharacterized protein DUF2029 [Breoghania corrubedonensis]|uniref:Uncharacterized protein DUF2029 n=1 Tax=Breoghania corrubedonensis TaxID=665038 RepID=A0A2T5VEW3_9HYPH|nr:glycosyltransferase family 87 protein [Breoghania corrubedonensis]PTW62299.1 uncharacterized protein DUF2029 [Breoghania corrubedonensis]
MSSIVTKMREGTWVRPDLVSFAVQLALAAYVLAFVAMILVPNPYHAPAGNVMLIDFLSFWLAAGQALSGFPAAPYDTAAFLAFQQALTGNTSEFFNFLYPPTWLLAVLPFGALDFYPAFLAFSALSLALFVAAMRMAAGDWRLVALLCAAPAAFNTLLHGQNTLISAALFAFALALLRRGGLFSAGLLIGLLTYKPQLGLLVPAALLVSGHWRTILGAGLSAIAIALASWAVLGASPWVAFVAQMHVGSDVLQDGSVPWARSISVYSAARLLGLDVATGWCLQALACVFAAAAVAWTWMRMRSFVAGALVLVPACVLATPYAFGYELTLMLVPAAFLLREGIEKGFLPYEKTALAGVLVFSGAAAGLAEKLWLPAGPLLLVIVILLGLRREAAAAPKPGGADQPAAASPARGMS